MYLVAIAWMYVVVMMAVAEAASPNGSILGALMTLVLYGLMPLSILMYILGTPARKRRLREQAHPPPDTASAQPDAGGHAAGTPTSAAAVAPVREEP